MICNSWLSVWTLSCCCPVNFYVAISVALLLTFLVVFFFGCLSLLQILRKPVAFSFAVLCIIVFRLMFCYFFHEMPNFIVVMPDCNSELFRSGSRKGGGGVKGFCIPPP